MFILCWASGSASTGATVAVVVAFVRSAKAGRTPHTEPEDGDGDEDDDSALLSGVVSGAEGRRETADDSMIAFMAKALPI